MGRGSLVHSPDSESNLKSCLRLVHAGPYAASSASNVNVSAKVGLKHLQWQKSSEFDKSDDPLQP